VKPWYADDVRLRFSGYGWRVLGPIDGHDVDAVDGALAQAADSPTQPTLIICRTTIGKGAPTRAGTGKAHGEPLGEAEVAATRLALGWTAAPFEVPARVAALWNAREAGAGRQARWREQVARYRAAHPELAAEFERRSRGELPSAFDSVTAQALADAAAKAETVATRKASQLALEAFTRALPELLGGSADLTGSNLTQTSSTAPLRFAEDGTSDGRHINYVCANSAWPR
jgi:transketolase